jgi:hypothetical protein
LSELQPEPGKTGPVQFQLVIGLVYKSKIVLIIYKRKKKEEKEKEKQIHPTSSGL